MGVSDVTATNKSQAPIGSNYQQEPGSNWYYFVDPEVAVWKKALALPALNFVVPAVAATSFLSLFGCSSRSLGIAPEAKPNDKNVAKREGFLRIIQSEAYAGRLIVFFAGAEIPGDVQTILKKYPAAKLQRSVSRTPEEETKRRQELEAKTGQKFLDWNRVYYLSARDKATAQQLQLELMETKGVRLIYPEQKRIGPSLASTPNLEGLQTYLQGPASGGLNITYAWGQGVFGAGVMVADGDNGFNTDHEEFELSRLGISSGGNNWGLSCRPEIADDPMYFCSSGNVAHGTATMGILHARHGPDNDPDGMRGLAPEAWATFGGPSDPSRLPSGSIALTECATQYSWDGAVTCEEGASGLACVPCLSTPLDYAWSREAFANGIAEFLTAGNGAINLDEVQLIDDETMTEICGGPQTDPAAADCWQGSGAILVGASQGDRDRVGGLPQKQSYSNCGSEVKLYGWGERVVTTSWHPESGPLSNYEWITVSGGPNPPNDEANAFFTNEFGGTSSAGAIVAGAATLVQSYFCDVADGTLAGDGSIVSVDACRYLTPSRLKTILIDSGMEAYTSDGCPIGRQPNMEEAFLLTSYFLENEVLVQFPELAAGEQLTDEQVDELRELGVGLGVDDPSNPPPPPLACSDYYPYLSKKMDIDGDGRGDLVSWTKGEWKIDLSSGEPVDPNCGQEGYPPCPPPNDNYGSWDIVLNYPPVSNWEVPVIADYNSDGQADLAIYDRENGKWNISFTDEATLLGNWNGWEQEINWPGVGDSNVWGAEFYTRPLMADYNGDDWTDLAVQTSDGHWQINFDWRNAEDGWSGCAFTEHGPLTPAYANADGIQDLAYLTADELAAYPGWAYLPALDETEPIWRGPDGIMKTMSTNGGPIFDLNQVGYPPLGGIENIPVNGWFENSVFYDFAAKTPEGFWILSDLGGIEMLSPNGVFGNSKCKPLVADLDGDGKDDRTVMCPEEWRIVYSGQLFAAQNDTDEVRHIPLSYTHPATLPGQPVFGGLSYERAEQVRNYMHELGLNNIPPLFDYAMTPYDYCSLPWFVEEVPSECL